MTDIISQTANADQGWRWHYHLTPEEREMVRAGRCVLVRGGKKLYRARCSALSVFYLIEASPEQIREGGNK